MNHLLILLLLQISIYQQSTSKLKTKEHVDDDGPPYMFNFYVEEPKNEAIYQQRLEEEMMNQRKQIRDASLREEIDKQYMQQIMIQQNEQMKQIQKLSQNTALLAKNYL